MTLSYESTNLISGATLAFGLIISVILLKSIDYVGSTFPIYSAKRPIPISLPSLLLGLMLKLKLIAALVLGYEFVSFSSVSSSIVSVFNNLDLGILL